jgi:hypothetical protein
LDFSRDELVKVTVRKIPYVYPEQLEEKPGRSIFEEAEIQALRSVSSDECTEDDN